MPHTYLRLSRWVMVGSLAIPLIFVVCTRILLARPFHVGVLINIAIILLGCLFSVAVFCTLHRRIGDSFDALSLEQTASLDQIPPRYISLAIILASGLSLFLELIIIRWQSTMFEFFAFYKNFGLLSCFAGLGFGYALANRDRIPLVLTPVLLVWQIGLMLLLRHGLHPLGLPVGIPLDSVNVTPIPEQLNMGFDVASSIPHYVSIYAFLSVVFLLTVLAFMPVGQLCGYLMGRRPSLRAYGMNLLGSLGGVLGSLVLSYLWTPPVIWFAIAFGVIFLFLAYGRAPLLIGGGCALLGVILLAWPVFFPWHAVYSPYQLLERGPGMHGQMTIRAEGHFFQSAHDLSSAGGYRNSDEQVMAIAGYYDLPYRLLDNPGRVAIVGAGTGNDVAAALRAGADRVDAVEIDPAIFQLGAFYHPEMPYSDPRVEVIINDARSFFRTTGQMYDIIIYGLLDSHILLNQAASLRIDSYVYTVQGLREARARLNEDGMLCLSFSMLSNEIGRKLYLMMTDVFDGRAPVCIRAGYDGGVMFLQTASHDVTVPSGLLEEFGFADMTSVYADAALHVDLPTDDWPFFYMPSRAYPISYVVLWCLVLVWCLVLAGSFLPSKLQFNHVVFFFLGAGFMLVETKGITEIGLHFGATWHVIGIVVAGILIMAFLANSLVNWLHIERTAIPYLFLFGSLVIGGLIAQDGGFTPTFWGRLATIVILTCPVFFSGMVFSILLKSKGNIAGAMALNLFGAMCGGMLEYHSMYFGFQFLYWSAIGLYGLAFLSTSVFRRAS